MTEIVLQFDRERIYRPFPAELPMPAPVGEANECVIAAQESLDAAGGRYAKARADGDPKKLREAEEHYREAGTATRAAIAELRDVVDRERDTWTAAQRAEVESRRDGVVEGIVSVRDKLAELYRASSLELALRRDENGRRGPLGSSGYRQGGARGPRGDDLDAVRADPQPVPPTTDDLCIALIGIAEALAGDRRHMDSWQRRKLASVTLRTAPGEPAEASS